MTMNPSKDKRKKKSFKRDILIRWALKWHSENRTDGVTEHFMFHNGLPLFFPNRKVARIYADKYYGYIKTREDLRQEPHGWRFPKPIKVHITIEEIQ